MQPLTYKFNNEVVPLERWTWGVVYRDGTELHQFDDKGVFHQFQEIDQERVSLFVMFKPDDPTKRIDTVVNLDMQLFQFYRNVGIDYGAPTFRLVRVFVFGWKTRETGEASYHFILPDDRVVMSTSPDIDLTKFEI